MSTESKNQQETGGQSDFPGGMEKMKEMMAGKDCAAMMKEMMSACCGGMLTQEEPPSPAGKESRETED